MEASTSEKRSTPSVMPYSQSAGIWRGARVAAYSFSLVASSKDPVAKIKLVVQYEANQEVET
jgi:hypothetical protein